jgi:FAD:protein FMN transferase
MNHNILGQPSLTSRRRFIAAGLGGFVVAQFKYDRALATPMHHVSESRRALGSKVSIQVIHSDQERAKKGIQNAFAAIEQVESVMSLYRSESQVSELNRTGILKHPSPDLVQTLQTAKRISEKSNGAFDITVQPLWTLYHSHSKSSSSPTESEINDTRRRVNWRNVQIRHDEVRFNSTETQITLNGMAQGFAADQARAALATTGIEHALIDCGELSTIGQNNQGKSWQVGIQHPRETEAFAALAQLNDRSLATSGDYETHFSIDFRQHHIFSPTTGQSPTELSSVSVAAPTALLADALSTTLFVLGSERGLELISSFENVDALLITKEGRHLATPGFPMKG